MNHRYWIGSIFVGGVAFLAIVGQARGQVVNITGASTGADGTPGTGTLGGDNIYHGNDGSSGYVAPNGDGTSFVFNGANLVGGSGGTVIGTDGASTYQGGYGGNGLLSQFGSSVAPLVTVNSGTYVGGPGGAATGVGALQLIGGGGGSGLDVNNTTALVNGGTFIGGAGGTTTDTNSFDYPAGPGLNANFAGIIIINDGNFIGGQSTQVASGGDGDGILGLGGTVSIYGGTFVGGPSGQGIDILAGDVTLYGTDFEVNGVPTTGALTGSGTITGILQNDRTPTSITFTNSGGTLDLVTVPEPASFGIVSLGIAATAGLRRRHLKRMA